MKERTSRTVAFPRSRLATFDIGAVAKRKHYVTALLEFDVTEARRMQKAEADALGKKISFTGWLLKAVAGAVNMHKEVAAFRRGRRNVVLFDDVDVSIVVEKTLDGRKVPLPLVIRKAQDKSVAEITAEIEMAKRENLVGERIVLSRSTSPGERLYYRLPGVLRRAVWKAMLRRPHFIRGKMGNVGLTSLGAVVQTGGWFIHTSIHPLSFGVGSIVPKPVVSGGEITAREILHLTMLIDHDAVDGGPMARFIRTLKEYIEGGYGLEGSAARPDR